MHLPYTDRYPEAIAIASQSLAASLTAVLWSRPLARRSATAVFAAAVWGTALYPELSKLMLAEKLGTPPSQLLWLQVWLGLTTLAIALTSPRWFAGIAAFGQIGLLMVCSWVRDSNDEVMFAHLLWFGALLGCHAIRSAPVWAPAAVPRARSFFVQDALIFTLTFALATYAMNRVFEQVVYNGDEVANSFQSDVYAHFKAYATARPCASSFENYWVFNYQGRIFSQYPPGWPLFMAPFQRLGAVYLAGPAAAGVLAVGVARLSRRAASGLGASLVGEARVVGVAGPLGAAFLMLGPSVLLNGGSRFAHTLVAASFAWAVECAAVIATAGISRRRAIGYGLGLGLATSLGVATRPPDGSALGVGVFLYFAWALFQRRVSLRAFLGTCVGFAAFGGLTLVILRLQVGSWFHTAYHVTPLFHPEGEVMLTAPLRGELKYGIPLATGSYCWWPIAPALGLGGLIRCLAGRERRVAFMLVVGAFVLVGFYSFVTFGRGGDDGLGPRYIMPVVVAQATGTAGLLAPLLARLFDAVRGAGRGLRLRLALAAPALLMFAAAFVGVYLIAPMTYPIAYVEHHGATAPLRAARAMGLKNAVVMLEPGRLPAHETNLAQNDPMDPNPSVLFVIRRSAADEACIQKHYPGRTWYRARVDDKLDKVAGH